MKHKKAWTIGGGLAFVALLASALAGGDYIIDKAAKPPLKRLICNVHDSLMQKDRKMMREAAIQSVKTQSFFKGTMTAREKTKAQEQWENDSALYIKGLEDGGR